ncbi:aminoglycoside phosphotransferase family protein [Actinopolymorpha pittospori]|uniref:Aminoglycoside phosphotransferase domain-containing protein n=1 Tax=Actinopolymorpha pittospori TaxID=648752 RepID=A0A927RBU9_9ACTN|nr:aminoglycoside phosphotransferase family protein [Actinopolymorpha pittospori]MBE1610532.1 hypothetical protein [Actinopolymorpha pittospori]
MRPAQAHTRIWASETWRSGAMDWVARALHDLGLHPTGPLAQTHLRPWSTVLELPTTDGSVWMKANGPGTAYEPRLLAALRRSASTHVLMPLAIDVDRAWTLLPDAGTSLRSLLYVDPDVSRWLDVLPAYAELQRSLAPRAHELIALGVPDLRPATIPGHFARLLADTAWLRLGARDGLAVEHYHRLRALGPQVVVWAQCLDAVGIGASLQHDDFHDGNVFVRLAAGGPAYVFLDWGDASVAHPFGTLVGTLRNVAQRLDLAPDAPELLKLRDAYLEPWSAEYDRADLLDAMRWATQLAKIGRALAWQRALTGANATERATYAEYVPRWLAELLSTDSW